MTKRRAVLLLAALLFFWRLGGHDLWDPDEAYFAEGAREMVVDGQWAVPHVNGRVTTDKPPLFFWTIALLSLPLGAVTPLSARLGSALAALGTVALTMRMGGRFFGPRTAALSGVLLSTTWLFWDKARWSQTDALLCLLIWVALSAFESFRSGEGNGLRTGLLFWLAAALAVLDKGPVGVLLPLGIAVCVLASDRELFRWRSFAPLAGPALFLAVVAAWIVLATVGGRGEYSVWAAFKEHFVERAVHGMHHRQPVWYFAKTLPPNLLPWTGLLPGALLLAWRRRGRGDRFLLTAALFVVAFFTISTEKRELYILPAVPAIALMAAALVAAVCGWEEPSAGARSVMDRRWVTVAQGVLGGTLAILGAALPFVAARVEVVTPATAWALGGTFLIAGVSALALAVRGRPLAAVAAPAAGVAVLYLLTVTVVYPSFEPLKSARPFAERVAELTRDSRARGIPVLAYWVGNFPKSLAFYTDGLYTVETGDPGELARHLERPDAAWAVAASDRVGDLPEVLRNHLFVMGEARLAGMRILLLTNRPLPGATPLSVQASLSPT